MIDRIDIKEGFARLIELEVKYSKEKKFDSFEEQEEALKIKTQILNDHEKAKQFDQIKQFYDELLIQWKELVKSSKSDYEIVNRLQKYCEYLLTLSEKGELNMQSQGILIILGNCVKNGDLSLLSNNPKLQQILGGEYNESRI